MIDDLDDDKWVDALREMARDYHEPQHAVPRDEMWDAITARRRAARALLALGVGPAVRRWAPLLAAAAVVLALGIGIGRSTSQQAPVAMRQLAPALVVLAPPPGAPTPNAPYQIIAAQQLVQVQALLTAFAADDRDRGANARLAGWARELLSNTRLLIDSPAGADPHRRQLLEDLELVLVQIVELSPDASASDRAAIDRTLADAQVLRRLRAAIPVNQVGL